MKKCIYLIFIFILLIGASGCGASKEQTSVENGNTKPSAAEPTPAAIKPKITEPDKMDIVLIPAKTNGDNMNLVHKLSENTVVRTGKNCDFLFISAAVGGGLKANPQYPNKDPMYLTHIDKYGINNSIRKYFNKYTGSQNAKAIYNLAVSMDNPPRKFVGPILKEMLSYDDGNLEYKPYQTIDTWNTLKQFSAETGAETFFEENNYLYQKMFDDFTKNKLTFNHVQRIEEFYGTDISNYRFVVVLSTVMGGGQATTEKNTDGSIVQYSIISPSDNMDDMLNTLYHETAHNFYDPRIDDRKLVEKYYKYNDALGKEEPDFATQLNETVTRAITAVIIEKYHGKDAAKRNLKMVDRQGYKNTREIYYLIKNKYIANRNKYKSFKEFMPIVFEYIKASSMNEPFDIGPMQ